MKMLRKEKAKQVPVGVGEESQRAKKKDIK